MAKRQAARSIPVDVEVVDSPASQDQKLVTADSTALRSFLGGLIPFFTKAGELERAAKERLDMARQLKPPVDAVTDEKVQLFIREAKAENKAVEDHWGITAVVHGLHRKLTAARGRATGMLDTAAQLAQNLHNTYVEAENARVRQEEDRRRRAAEEQARLDRDQELEQLEAAALKVEQSSPKLSEREELFVDATIRLGQRPTPAAQTAGFRNPAQAGERLMNTPKITAAIDAKKQAAVIREQAAAQAAMPVEAAPIEKVERQVTRAAGGYDRTTHGAEVFDEQALIVAALDPMMRTRLGIPADIVTINRVKVNEYGNSLKELINTWPGVRHTKKTSTV